MGERCSLGKNQLEPPSGIVELMRMGWMQMTPSFPTSHPMLYALSRQRTKPRHSHKAQTSPQLPELQV